MTWSLVLAAFTRAGPRMSSRGAFLVRASFWLWAAVASRLVSGLLPDDVPVPPPPHAASGDFRGRDADIGFTLFWSRFYCIP